MADNRRSWDYLDSPVETSFAWSLALTLLPVVAAFAVSWIVARFGGVTVWGTVSWAMALATALLIPAKLGLGLGASRLASELGVSRPGALRALVARGLRLRAAATAAVAGACALAAGPIARAFGDASLEGAVRAAAAVIVGASLYEFFEHVLVGLNRHGVVSRVRAGTLSLRVVFTASLVAAGAGAVAILGGYVAAWAVGIAAVSVALWKRLPSADGESHDELTRRLLRLSVPLAISSASVTIYSQMDRLMIGWFDGVAEVGQYSIARAVVEVSLFPAFAAVLTLRPALAARFAAGEREACAALLGRGLRLTLVAGVLFASLFAVLGTGLVTTVYSAQYAYAGALMAYFAGVLVMRAPGALILPALVAAERTRFYAGLTTASAALNFVLNLVLIPRMHARGAIVATLVSYGALMAVGLVQVARIFGMRPGARAALAAVRTLLAGALAAGATWWIVERLVPGITGAMTFAVAAVHAALFVALAWGLRALGRDDLRGLGHNPLRGKK